MAPILRGQSASHTRNVMKISAKQLVLPGVLFGAGLVTAQDPVLNGGETGSHGDPFTPVGKLKVTPTVVQPGVQPNMFWEIEYPKSIEDLTVIVEPGKLVTTNTNTETLEVRVAGVSYESGEGVDLPVAMWVRLDGGSWDLIFYGRTDEVDPSNVVFSQSIPEGTQVDFAFRGRKSDGSWGATQWTLEDTPNIDSVISGDPVPADSSAFSSGSVESFVTQFVDDSTNTIVAGPRDIIYFSEVGSTTPGSTAFDMQDLVALVKFRDNRGHGNNADGYDADNTGTGTSGVGGVDDTIVNDELGTGDYLDDEGKKIKRKDVVIATE